MNNRLKKCFIGDTYLWRSRLYYGLHHRRKTCLESGHQFHHCWISSCCIHFTAYGEEAARKAEDTKQLGG
ncbi:hypothetical protein [Planococcus maitriensis]|uniref:hypothetical protein n=1 Tax=Planococcus maitriensis TaxID=221799 RepID=UPI0011BF63A5|nr:hypothetical protein [Planococcus maitriensis]